MQKFKIDRKIIFYLAFYFGTIVMLGVLPLQIKRMLSLRNDIRGLEKNISDFENQEVARGNFEKQKEVVKEEIVLLKEKILGSQEVFAASAYISAKAKEQKVEVHEIGALEQINYKQLPEGTFKLLPIKLEASAGFHELAKFFAALENGEYVVEIKDLVLRENNPNHAASIVFHMLIKQQGQ